METDKQKPRIEKNPHFQIVNERCGSYPDLLEAAEQLSTRLIQPFFKEARRAGYNSDVADFLRQIMTISAPFGIENMIKYLAYQVLGSRAEEPNRLSLGTCSDQELLDLLSLISNQITKERRPGQGFQFPPTSYGGGPGFIYTANSIDLRSGAVFFGNLFAQGNTVSLCWPRQETTSAQQTITDTLRGIFHVTDDEIHKLIGEVNPFAGRVAGIVLHQPRTNSLEPFVLLAGQQGNKLVSFGLTGWVAPAGPSDVWDHIYYRILLDKENGHILSVWGNTLRDLSENTPLDRLYNCPIETSVVSKKHRSIEVINKETKRPIIEGLNLSEYDDFLRPHVDINIA